MKTFSQFVTWMLTQQAWDEFLKERKHSSTSVLKLYNSDPENVIAFAFSWVCTAKGYDYWSKLSRKWRAFYRQENIKKYKFVYVNKKIASVELPKNPTTIVVEFVKSSLKEKHPSITDFEWKWNWFYMVQKRNEIERN